MDINNSDSSNNKRIIKKRISPDFNPRTEGGSGLRPKVGLKPRTEGNSELKPKVRLKPRTEGDTVLKPKMRLKPVSDGKTELKTVRKLKPRPKLKPKPQPQKSFLPKINAKKVMAALMLFMFFFAAGAYLLWTYAVPIYLEGKYDAFEISKNIGSKIGFDMQCEDVKFYTTPSLSVGADINNLVLNYPSTREKYEFLKAKRLIVEVPLIPLFSKTIKFNKFTLKSLLVNLYQDENGNYPFIQQIKNDFNPKLPQYELIVPPIEIIGYSFKNFNAQTMQYKEFSGKNKTITAYQSKEVLEKVNQKTIKIK